MDNIVLASASPRRIEMFKERGLNPRICPSNTEETIPFEMSPGELTMYLSLKKALAVAGKNENTIVVGADTVVYKEGYYYPGSNSLPGFLEKPGSRDEAYSMLLFLRDTSHQVITGVSVVDMKSDIKLCFYDVSKVTFNDFPLSDLSSYVETDEPYDKAAGYAIQGHCGSYIASVEGDRDNVIGFPMSTFLEKLKLVHDHRKRR